MSELLREQMSAFIDDALPAEESDVLLRRLQSDEALGKVYACYHLIGASLRREPDASALAARVRDALRAESLPVPTAAPAAWRRLLKPALGVAVAASVAVVAIASLQTFDALRGGPAEQIAQTTPTGVNGSGEPQTPYTTPASVSRPTQVVGNNANLLRYAIAHSSYATSPSPSIMNYRIVGAHTASGAPLPETDDPQDAPQESPRQ